MKKTVLVIGLGEVGKPLYEIIKESGKYEVYGLDLIKERIPKDQGEIPRPIDIMHVCYPCFSREEFIEWTVKYIEEFKPKLTIIESTVAPGTTSSIHRRTRARIVHSPVRGIHENMKNDLFFWRKYIGGVDEESALDAQRHFNELGLKTRVLRSPIETELAKLFETTYRALMISWFQEMHRICRAFKADFLEVIDMLEDVHKVRFDRPIFYPGFIGGHCLIPNAELLLKAYKSKFIEAVLESNKLRQEELNDPAIKAEVDSLKERVKKLELEISKYPYKLKC